MPSQIPIPTITDLVQVFHQAISGTKDITADGHAGSVYDQFAGIGAIVWSWQAQRDKDQYETLYFDRATGQFLTDYVKKRFNIDRILDAAGTGSMVLSRASTSAGAGTIWKGTRISFLNNNSSIQYEVSSNVDVSAAETSVIVPIIASSTGTGSLIFKTNNTIPLASIQDPLWDNTWKIIDISCSDGTDFEKAEEFRSRVRQAELDIRVGYSTAILNACKSVGADNVFLFQSDYGGDDWDNGVNVAYVGDIGYTTTDDLIYKTKLILESYRVAGADLLVLPMQKQNISFNVKLTTWDDPNKLNSYDIRRTAIDCIADYFDSTNAFSYNLTTLGGYIRRLMPNIVHSVDFIVPTSGVSFLSGLSFPSILTKYEVNINDIVCNLVGPS